MGSGFLRRFAYFPPTNVIVLIEGVIVADVSPPGNFAGISSGVACLVGEFPDATYGVSVDTSGNVTQVPDPVQIFSGQDLIDKVGGFDSTIGDFGGTMGNGFVELRNKTFAQLILVPVPLVASKGVRAWRQLPFNVNATTPSPFVPMQAASVPAATPFMSGTNQVNTAKKVGFTGLNPYLYGTDGFVTASTGATEQFNALSGNFINGGVAVGDAIVLGAPLSSATLQSPTGGSYIGAQDNILFAGWTGYPTGPGLLQIENEFAFYTGVTASATAPAFVGVTRAANGSAGVTHAAGVAVVGMSNVDTYRVATIPGATQLTLQRQNGQNFSTSLSFGATGVPWRIHKSTDAESAAGLFVTAGTYDIPARPLTASIAAASQLTPKVAAPQQTYQQWDPLAGLTAATDPTTGLVYVAATMAANAAANASIDALYSAAIAVLQSQDLPEATINLLWAARKSSNIRSALKTSVVNESSIGVGRMAVIAPALQEVTTTSQALATADPGVGGNRAERVAYTWPPVRTYVPEAVNILIKGADGRYYQDGIIDMPTDGWLVAVMSNINPEWNPGQASPPVPQVLSPIAGLARNAPKTLGINDYTAMRQAGICGIRIDRTVGPVFQSGVTTSLTVGETTIQRRRMADFCEDSIAQALGPKAKMPATIQWRDDVLQLIDAFLEDLKSPNNPQAQRINDYYVDDASGNTDALNSLGVFVWIIGIKLTPTADFIVTSFQVGNGVVIPTQQA